MENFMTIWIILWHFGIFYGILVYFMAFSYNLWSFGIFFPFWYVWTKNNLATLAKKDVRSSEFFSSFAAKHRKLIGRGQCRQPHL
jgi:hypothetical protein